MYSDKFKIDACKLMKRFWGDEFYNPTEKKWGKEYTEGYVRGFNQFILEPIYKVCILTTRDTLGGGRVQYRRSVQNTNSPFHVFDSMYLILN